ncbi:MAG TPA: YkgJ family cysteine cluster protein [Methanomicrobiales archaeon]|nr:YkgJ family cysteine cluster protein [Methanomicrobiales archaeon]
MDRAPLNPDPEGLAALIGDIGFSCRRCGACCRPGDGDSGLVFASHDEIAALVAAGAGSWDEVAGPYPDFIACGDGSAVTFGWCLRHEGGRCRFLGDGGCTVYRCRPWICRTYPFALVDGELVVSDCPGLGSPISREDAFLLAVDLLGRAQAEEADEELVRDAFARTMVPDGKRCVVDSAGMKVLGD